MGFIGALVSVCKAMPVLERLVLSLADAVREAKAKSRHESKLAHIDAAIGLHRVPDDGGAGQRPDPDGAPTVSQGRTGRA